MRTCILIQTFLASVALTAALPAPRAGSSTNELAIRDKAVAPQIYYADVVGLSSPSFH